MPHLQIEPASNGSEVSPSPAAPIVHPGSGEALDHLARMSGTGSSFGQAEYVAINPLSVASLVFGLICFLSLVFTLFLAAAAVGVFLGLLSIRKIRHSNGTQSGLALAGAGVLISLVVGGTVAARTMNHWAKEREYTRKSCEAVASFGEEIKARHYDYVYDNIMTSAFRDKFARSAFSDRLQLLLNYPQIGTLESYRSTDEPIEFEPIVDSDATQAMTVAVVKFSKFEGRQTVVLNNLEGAWKIDALPDIFQIKRKKGPSGGQ